jgi:hypothetical protein
MLVKKTPTTSPARSARKELEYLYARRNAINTLIQSLEQYDRFRALRFVESKRKSA